MCRRYPGFLRAAIADPQPERRWFRRGWVTFKRHVNIKDICWNLNNIRVSVCAFVCWLINCSEIILSSIHTYNFFLVSHSISQSTSFLQLRDCELGAIVNRDLSRRIRTVNGITSHRGVVRADIKLAAKIIQNLDSRWILWSDAPTTADNPVCMMVFLRWNCKMNSSIFCIYIYYHMDNVMAYPISIYCSCQPVV